MAQSPSSDWKCSNKSVSLELFAVDWLPLVADWMTYDFSLVPVAPPGAT
jgi:hypothetical protein